ncbi:osteocalcin 2-like [Mastacembelus armatus]|uniref:osteocalcin 2-like n=1 Tax=Mastacembelus armatus TaxID=205130 RepID=UPI000E457D83|nr:osteocalcin 2-like [Mastacembelus armatus]XP_026152437.1 osteocalcin 2-like [Mastacembelus armatus]
MKFLPSTLIIILLTKTSAMPIGRHRHHDADIADNNWRQEWFARDKLFWQPAESSTSEDSSSESESSESSQSSESQSSESQSSEESSEEVLSTTQIMPTRMTAATPTPNLTTAATATPDLTTAATATPDLTTTATATPNLTTAATATPDLTTAATATVTMGDRSTLTVEPDTVSTDEPLVTDSTTLPATPTMSIATSTSNVTHSVTKDIPTAAPITESRGDN